MSLRTDCGGSVFWIVIWKRKYFLDSLYENGNIFWMRNCADQNDFSFLNNFLPKIQGGVDARFLFNSF